MSRLTPRPRAVVSAAAPPLLVAQTLGAARLALGDMLIGTNSGMLFPLLVRLLFTPGMTVPRSALLVELWPHLPDARRQGNLRQALYKLRSLGLDAAMIGDEVRLVRTQVGRSFCVERSAELFEQLVLTGREPLGPFLAGWTAATSEFQIWVEHAREAVHADVRRVLVEQLRSKREQADWNTAETLARWLLQFDPLNEEATLTFAECTMMSGAKAEAVAILDRYLAELGPGAGDIRLPATQLRRRFMEPPARRRPTLTTERHFVGREQELADLTLALRRARWHDGSAVLLHGPPGIGKTRLVAELTKVAQIEGYREVLIECRESDQTRPLAVLLEVLPDLMNSPGSLGCAPESLSVLRRLMGEEDEYRNWRPLDERGRPDEFDSPALKNQSIRHSIIDLIAAIADERPIYFIVEDIHWIDDASWEIMSDLVQRISTMRVFMVGTSRYLTIRAERPERVPLGLHVRALPFLSRSEAGALTQAIGHELTARISSDTEEWITGCSEGSPLMLRALVEHWVHTGEAGGIPPSLAHLLDYRLDRLSGTALRALQTICLLSRFASLDRIKGTLQLPSHELLDALEQLESNSCLQSNQASLVVSHDLVGQAALKRLSPLVEASLRSAISEVLDAEFQENKDHTVLVEALRHCAMSNRPDAICRLLARYENFLPSLGQPALLLEITSRAKGSGSSWLSERQLSRIAARLESENGEFGRALAFVPGEQTLRSAVELLSAEEVDEGLSFIESAFRSDPVSDASELGAFAGNVATCMNTDLQQRVRAADIGLVIAANTCDEVLARRCYFGLGLDEKAIQHSVQTQKIGLLYHSVFGKVETADSIARSIFHRAISAKPSTTVITEIGRAGFVFKMIGKPADAENAFIRARGIAYDLESRRLAEYPVWQLAQLSLELGNTLQSNSWTHELLELASANNDEQSNSFIHSHLCLFHLSNGDIQQAQDYLDRCKRALPRIPHVRSLAFSLALEMTLRLADETWIPSDDVIDVAIDRFNRTASFAASDLLASAIGEGLFRRDEFSIGESLLRRYLGEMRRELCPPSARLQSTLRSFKLPQAF